MVFLDGGVFTKKDRYYRGSVVLDNLIHEGAMPVTVGLFVKTGTNYLDWEYCN